MEQETSSQAARVARIAAVAASLNAARIRASRRPAPFILGMMTDPRIPISKESIARLPALPEASCAVIFRHYGVPERKKLAEEMRKATGDAGHLFLVAGDEALAAHVGADGIHLPEWQADETPNIKQAHPEWIVSTACHSREAADRAQRYGADCALLSPIFSTTSHPDAKPLGTDVLKTVSGSVDMPVLALGGVDEKNIVQLEGSGAAGIAAISALSQD